nr:neutrophil antibiotic peptide NP-3A-like [Dasypus novemcinctus]
MRTLAVLSTVLLLTFLTHAEPLRESTDELPAQEHPETQDEEMAIYFVRDKRATREASDPLQGTTCLCRTDVCKLGEIDFGTCTLKGTPHKLCCS